MNHKISIAKFFIWLITSFLFLILAPASNAQTAAINTQVKKTFLKLNDGRSLSQQEFNALKTRISKLFKKDYDFASSEYEDWTYYKGNLKVNSDFLNSNGYILVDGDLIVEGLYDDQVESMLFVLGNMQAENVFSEFQFYVSGNLTVSGVISATDDQTHFEVGKQITTKILIDNQRNIEYKSLKAELAIFSEKSSELELLEAARRFVPELYFENFNYEGDFSNIAVDSINDYEFTELPDHLTILKLIQNKTSIFREKIAMPASSLQKDLANASVVSSKNQLIKNTENKQLDPLVLMVYAGRNDLPDQAVVNLIQKKNSIVLGLLARNPDLKVKFFAEIAALSPDTVYSLINHKNVNHAFTDSIVKHSNPEYRKVATWSDNLTPLQIESLALDSSIMVRQFLFARIEFEPSQKIIDGNIKINDETLLMNLMSDNINLTQAHYEQLASYQSLKIRTALATNLTNENIFARYKKSSHAERLLILRKLSLDPNIKLKAIALRGLSAKEQEQALDQLSGNLNSSSSNKTALLFDLLPYLNSKKIAIEIIESQNEKLIHNLADNKWLSEDIQTQMIESYFNNVSNPNKKLSPEQKTSLNYMMYSLLKNEKVFPSVLEKISSFCFSHLTPPDFCEELSTQTLSSKTLKQFSSIKNANLKAKMYQEIDSQPYATKTDLVNVIAVEEFSYGKFLKKMISSSDDDFWIALSELDLNNNLSVAAVNVHTPLQALKKLEKSSANLEDELLRNPIYPVQLKQNLMLKHNQYVDIKELSSDFYTDVINLKIKTGYALSKSDKEEISSILMKRYMMKQFQ